MLVPISVADFIDRAVRVYGERTGVVDEPAQPAASLGDLTFAEVGAGKLQKFKLRAPYWEGRERQVN